MNFRFFYCVIGLVFLYGNLPGVAAEATGPDSRVAAFFSEHCNRCHGEKEQRGNFRVDTLVLDFSSPKNLGHWEEIMNRMNSGDMPPEDEPRPIPADIVSVSDWILAQLREAEAAQQGASGDRVSFRKLSRDEYACVIRDLLGVSFDPTGPVGLPVDPDWHGFERIGSVLTLSPTHIEKHLAAAELILDEALSLGPKPQCELIHWDGFTMRYHDFKKEYAARGIAEKVRVDIVPNNYTTDSWNLKVKVTGEYQLRVQLSGLRPATGPSPRLKIYLPSIDTTLLEQDIDAPEDAPIVVEARVHLLAGSYPVRIINSVPGPNPEARRSRHSGTPTAFTSTRTRVPWQLKLTDDDFQAIEPTLLIDSVDWEGPLVDSWPTAAHREIFFGDESTLKNADYARAILRRFTERAWRRPVDPEEVERLVRLVEKAQQLGDDFEHAVKTALIATLCSKSFLYLEEGSTASRTTQLSDWELASRLSFFLWSSAPDQELLDLARTDRLHEPRTLRAQAQRLLKDRRSLAFAESFPRQWLQLRKVGMFPPDRQLYPTYDENLEQSFVAETTGFFREVLQINGSLRLFLDSDWALLNERLSQHYGIGNIRGDHLQRVALRAEDHRGGLLTQGAILSLTSDGTRHRPVHRGVWVMESIVGRPPPPPPANVPALDTPAANQPKMSIRETLQAHLANPNCAACHIKIDPLGMAFENYDAIGRWRTVENVRDGTGANPALDASGKLVDGRTFTDAAEFKQLLIADLHAFAVTFTEKLSTYALRRGMTFSDREELKRIVQQSEKEDFALASLIEELVASPVFVKR